MYLSYNDFSYKYQMHNQEKMKQTFPDVCIAGKGINVMHYYYY